MAPKAGCNFNNIARLPPYAYTWIHSWEFGHPEIRKYFWDDLTNLSLFVESGGYEPIEEEKGDIEEYHPSSESQVNNINPAKP